MSTRPAITLVAITTKKLGQDVHKEQAAGTACKAERNGGNMGEFILWFRDKYYFKVATIDFPTVARFTDGKLYDDSP